MPARTDECRFTWNDGAAANGSWINSFATEGVSIGGRELAGLLQLHLGVATLNNAFAGLGAENVAAAGGAYVAFA